MRRAFGSYRWPAAFVLTAAGVFAVLGWVTVAALRVERAQRETAAQAELGNNLRVALWRLDGRVLPVLGVEDSRPFHHYTTADPLQGSTAGPTPLLAAPLPEWMKLHVQLDPVAGWESPQVLDPAASARVAEAWPDLPLRNNTADRAAALDAVKDQLPSGGTWSVLCARDRATPPDARPFAAPLVDPQPPSADPAAPVAASSPAKPPPAELELAHKPGEAFRLLGWEFAPPANARVASKARPNSPPPRPTVAPAQQQAAFNGRAGSAADNEKQLNDLRTRLGPIARGVQEAKGAAQDPYQGKGFGQSWSNPNNDQSGFNGLGNLQGGLQGGQMSDQKDNGAATDRARDLLKKLQAEQFRELTNDPDPPRPVPPGEDRPAPGMLSNNLALNTVSYVSPPVVSIHLGSMRPQWITAADGSDSLVLVRPARLDDRTLYQGVVLDWPKLREVLTAEVRDLFPNAKLVPVKAAADVSPDRAMTALPLQLDPGVTADPPPAGWTPLRLGLVFAWVAAAVLVAAVGFSGWTLLDLAERRMRFVSAVTHELRTPLTSLRLYLDLLMSGMIQDEAKRQEYLNTLATESDRLHRLIDNVLDFARLEKRARGGDIKPTKVTELVESLRATWADRVAADGKELVVVSTLPAEADVCTDSALVGQIVGNLIDNARKYTRDAADRRIWLWVKPGGAGRVVFEVEDRGAGVPAGERKLIFQPFRRGEQADTTAGGAGLGLALAKQWAEVLGGTLTYRPADGASGACFRLELPAG
jgi:signal transduction histidine kinase